MQDFLSQQLIQKLLKLSQSNANISKQHLPIKNQNAQNSQIQSLLKIPFRQRTPKIIKKIKNLLKDFNCFKMTQINHQNNQQNGSSNIMSQNSKTKSYINEYLKEKKKSNEIQEILKRDIKIFINIISMYSSIAYYSKGQIIDITGRKRQKIRILIKGDVAICQPTNMTSLKNCAQKFKSKKQNNQLTLQEEYNLFVQKVSQKNHKNNDKNQWERLKEYTQKNLLKQDLKSQVLNCNNEQNYLYDEKRIVQILSFQPQNDLQQQNLIQLLKLSHIISPFTPHKITLQLQNQGKLLSSSKQTSIFNQNSTKTKGLQNRSTFTSICCSNQCILLEIDYQIYKQILFLINNNQEKPYISALMNKFQFLTYQNAIQYIKKKSAMIDFSKIQKMKNYDGAANQIQSENESDTEIKNQTMASHLNQNQKRKQIKQLAQTISIQKHKTNQYFKINQVSPNKNPNNQTNSKQFIQVFSRNLNLNGNLNQQSTNDGWATQPLISNNQTKEQFTNEQFKNKVQNQSHQRSNEDFEQKRKQQKKIQIQQNVNTQQNLQQNSSKIDLIPKEQSSTLYSQLPYTNQPYLIIQGQVIITINIISHYQQLNPKYSSPRKILTKHQILKIYSNDIFGLQSIGQQKQYGLKYLVRKNSKVLKMDLRIMKRHSLDVPKFWQEMEEVKSRRNQVIRGILGKLEKRLEKEMLSKYWGSNNGKENGKKELKYQNDEDKQQEQLKNRQYLSQNNRFNGIKQSSNSERKSNLSQNMLQSTSTELENKTNKHKKSLSSINISTSFKQKLQLRQIEYIGKKQFPQIQKLLLNKLQKKQKQQFRSTSQRLTVQLIKQFKLVDFKDNNIKSSEETQNTKSSYIQMRNPKTGVLLRKRSVPCLQAIQNNKNHKTIQTLIRRKIGLLTQQQRMKHNLKIVKNRKSPIKYQNVKQIQNKEYRRLKNISKSLPRLETLFSKKADIQYNCQKMIKITF